MIKVIPNKIGIIPSTRRAINLAIELPFRSFLSSQGTSIRRFFSWMGMEVRQPPHFHSSSNGIHGPRDYFQCMYFGWI